MKFLAGFFLILGSAPSIIGILIRNALGQLPPPPEELDNYTFIKGPWLRTKDDWPEKDLYLQNHKEELEKKYGISYVFYNHDACSEHVIHTCPKYIIRVFRNGLHHVIYLSGFDGTLKDGETFKGFYYHDPSEPWKSFPIKIKVRVRNDQLEIEEWAFNPLKLYYKHNDIWPNH